MASLLKKSWVTWAEVTTFHGIHDLVFANKKWARFLWAAILLASCLLLIWCMYGAVMLFLEYPVVVSVIFPEVNMFPPIRLYTPAFLNQTKATSKNLTSEHMCFMLGYFQEWPTSRTEWALDTAPKFKPGMNWSTYLDPEWKNAHKDADAWMIERYAQGFNPNRTYAAQLKQEIDEVATKNNITGIINLVKELSYEPDFFIPSAWSEAADTASPTFLKVVDQFGVSYQLEARKNSSLANLKHTDIQVATASWELNANTTVFSYALEPVFDKGPILDEEGAGYSAVQYQSIMRERCPHRKFSDGASFILVVGDDILKPEEWIKPDSQGVNSIIITAEFKHLINRPRNPCNEENISIVKCEERCTREVVRGKGDCSGNDGSELKFFNGGDDPSDQFYNLYNSDANSTTCQEKIDLANKCIQGCINPCQSWTYKVDLKYEQPEIPEGPPISSGFLKKKPCCSVKMAIGWRAVGLEEMYLYTVPVLLANFGGLLGLFLGGSLISLLQFIAFWIWGTCIAKASPAEEKKEVVRVSTGT